MGRGHRKPRRASHIQTTKHGGGTCPVALRNQPEEGCKLGLPMWAVRIAVSGMMVTPGGPGEIMEIIGKEEAMRRYDLALEKLDV